MLNELVRRERPCASGEAEYIDSRRRFLRILTRIAGDAASAEDALHESWLRTLSGCGEDAIVAFDPACVGAEAFRVAHRIRRSRRLSVRMDLPDEFAIYPRREGSHACDGRGRILKIIREEFSRLTSPERDLLLFRYGLWSNAATAARVLGISRPALQSRLKRARMKLRDAVRIRIQQLSGSDPGREDTLIYLSTVERRGREGAKGMQEQLAACRMVWFARSM
ncbi:MAG: sigma-70 family RNA polymerase sigma factor [Planctomycetes bacterium]|nr:sigma-70 family RNA polymerase sigma factor [Planctomycetota bacterium]